MSKRNVNTKDTVYEGQQLDEVIVTPKKSNNSALGKLSITDQTGLKPLSAATSIPDVASDLNRRIRNEKNLNTVNASYNISTNDDAEKSQTEDEIKSLEDQKTRSTFDVTTDPLSYRTFLQDLLKFRQAGGTKSSDFNKWDTPGNMYFRILFHFITDDNGTESSVSGNVNNPMGNGLLSPTWMYTKDNQLNGSGDFRTALSRMKEGLDDGDLFWWKHSSAFSYLMENADYERAELLFNFINLLSNINSESPWYWQKITGIPDGLDRPMLNDNYKLEFPTDRKKITIECLPDPVDERIGNLLDMYRAIVFSNQSKRVVLPSNLRKFDMTIVLFQQPIKGFHTPKDTVQLTDALGMASKWLTVENLDYATLSRCSTLYKASFKAFEFHNCEIDYNSSKSMWETLDNTEGTRPTAKIDIFFDDVFETRYNMFESVEFGDMLLVDTLMTIANNASDPRITVATKPDGTMIELQNWAEQIGETGHGLEYSNGVDPDARIGITNSVTNQLMGWLNKKVSNKVNHLILGNLYGLSLANTVSDVSNILGGDYINGVSKVEKALTKRNTGKAHVGGNIFADSITKSDSYSAQLGNIFRSNTIANSI